MAGISASLIASVLSMSLMASGTAKPLQLKETDPVAVASLQANLDVLGFNAGAPNGHISASTYQAMTKFVTQFGQRSSEPINVQVAHIVRSLPDLGTHLSGASILAMQSWLARWRLYHGALNGQSSTALIHALNLFQQDTGIPRTNQFNGQTLATLAHLAVVSEAISHHWQYTVEPGDQMRQLAWVAHIPLKQFEAMNGQHKQVLWVGQVIHFTQTAKKMHPPHQPTHHRRPSEPITKKKTRPFKTLHHSSTTRKPASSSPAPSTGVFSNIQPIAAFVVYNPSSSSLTALLQAQKSYPHDFIDVAITGQWAINHSDMMKKLAQRGNEIVMSGYTGVSLNQLPEWGVRQEIQWSQRAFEDAIGNKPAFVTQSAPFSPKIRNDLSALNVVSLSANVMAPSPWSTANTVSMLLTHPDQIVGTIVYPNSITGWQGFFRQLQHHHFVFLSLGQIWADMQ